MKTLRTVIYFGSSLTLHVHYLPMSIAVLSISTWRHFYFSSVSL